VLGVAHEKQPGVEVQARDPERRCDGWVFAVEVHGRVEAAPQAVGILDAHVAFEADPEQDARGVRARL
jgi:hypothetical protein